MAQIARIAEVSSATVSKVFNCSPTIPIQTRRRVFDVARGLGVRPRVGLKGKQIALITEPPWNTVMGGYVNTMSQYICYALSRADAQVVMITEDRIEDKLSNSWLDGVIGMAWYPCTFDILMGLKNLPVIWFNESQREYFHCIYTNARENGRVTGNYFMDKGHRLIAVIYNADSIGVNRVEGVADAMKGRGLDSEQMLLRLPIEMPMHLAVKQLLHAGCTAVWVTGNDLKVMEVNWLLKELAGKRIPEDISLMGFENPGISEFMCPSLTTIASPLREMAEKAVELVLNPPEHLVSIEMPGKLIERDSVGMAAKKLPTEF